MKQVLHLIFTLITVLLVIFTLLLSIKLSNISEKVENEQDELYKTQAQLWLADGCIYSYNKDTYYKLFFGEWEVVDIINPPPSMETPDIIGTKFYYDYDMICKNGNTIIVKNPIYKFYIIPKEDEAYLGNIPSPANLGLLGEYSILIKVNENALDGTYFYVKDDQTLILISSNNVCYEMRRISYFSK